MERIRQAALNFFFRFAYIVLSFATCDGVTPAEVNEGPDQVTVPLIIEGNRPYVDVAFRRPDGSTRSARFLVDSGGGGFIITEPIARDLGLKWENTIREGEDTFGFPTVTPRAFVGEMPLDLDPKRVLVAVGADKMLPRAPGGRREGVFPGHLLARYHVVFDYPNGKFTLARPGALNPKGIALSMPVSKSSGFPRIEIEVDGTAHGFLLDTGASFTMVSEILLNTWGKAHPEWPRHPGAFGEAATLGGQTLETMFLPGGRWGTVSLGEFGVTSQSKGTFENYMSSMMTSPIVGSIGGNVLKRFRVELDYPNEKVYLSSD
jgi:hypothetical protein